MPIYTYENTDTKKRFDILRPVRDRDKQYKDSDGTVCKRVIDGAPAGWRTDREGFEIDSDFYKESNPKYVRYRDGHRERYDSTRHC